LGRAAARGGLQRKTSGGRLSRKSSLNAFPPPSPSTGLGGGNKGMGMGMGAIRGAGGGGGRISGGLRRQGSGMSMSGGVLFLSGHGREQLQRARIPIDTFKQDINARRLVDVDQQDRRRGIVEGSSEYSQSLSSTSRGTSGGTTLIVLRWVPEGASDTEPRLEGSNCESVVGAILLGAKGSILRLKPRKIPFWLTHSFRAMKVLDRIAAMGPSERPQGSRSSISRGHVEVEYDYQQRALQNARSSPALFVPIVDDLEVKLWPVAHQTIRSVHVTQSEKKTIYHSRSDIQLVLIAVPAPTNRPLPVQDLPSSPSSSSQSEDDAEEDSSNTSKSSSSSLYDFDDDDSPPAPPPSVASSRGHRGFPFKKFRGVLTVFFVFLLLLLNQALMIAFLHLHTPPQPSVPGGSPATAPPFGGPPTLVVVVLCREAGVIDWGGLPPLFPRVGSQKPDGCALYWFPTGTPSNDRVAVGRCLALHFDIVVP
ncbi:hypothetical protein C8F04DRAFT_1197350, partial [Mycena alexandri]